MKEKKKKNFSSDEKRAIFDMLLQESRDQKLPKGVISRVANSFSISSRSVSRIWHETNGCQSNFSSKLMKRVGRKRIEAGLE